MGLPPGITYLLGVIPHFAFPSIATYVAFKFIQARQILPFHVPHLVVYAAAVLARPIVFYTSKSYSIWANKRAAKAHGAVVAPYVQESVFSIMGDIVESVKNGYPGGSFLLNQILEAVVIINCYHFPQLMFYYDGIRHMEMSSMSTLARVHR